MKIVLAIRKVLLKAEVVTRRKGPCVALKHWYVCQLNCLSIEDLCFNFSVSDSTSVFVSTHSAICRDH